MVKSLNNNPAQYTLAIQPYSGDKQNKQTDAFEPDDELGTATLLKTGEQQEHTIFPDNDEDFFKVSCSDHDTFTIAITLQTTTARKDSLGFSFQNYFKIMGYPVDIEQLSRTDSSTSIQ